MTNWDVTVQLVPEPASAVFRRIAAAIVTDVERGRLQPGEQLPSSRALSLQLGVHRNTVLSAYNDLRSRGWIVGSPSKGMFVADRGAPASVRSPPIASPASAGFDLPEPMVPDLPNAERPCRYVMLGGVPDLRFLPITPLARAYRDALRSSASPRLFGYADALGDSRLRGALAELLARVRGIPARPDGVCVVRGGQHALYLVARALLRPGDVVAAEAYGFPGAHAALRLAGVSLRAIPIDRDGLDVDALEALIARTRVRAVYLTPHHQCPTTVALSPERRRRLLDLARRHRVVVIEDDYDFDFHFDGPPCLPLASSDTSGVVVYVGTMSKTLAPGLRLGYVAATPDVTRRIGSLRYYVDRQGDHAIERAVATLLEDGVVQRHARRASKVYHRRRDALCEALARHLPHLEVRSPAGGMAVWARAPGIDVDAWAARSREAGVAFQAGRLFRLDGQPDDGARIGFGACDEREIEEAVRRMAAAWPDAA